MRCIRCFNSRTRVGATRCFLCRRHFHWFQFTHPCGCDHWGGLTSPRRFPVSIHAPVWVRRSPGAFRADSRPVSIHAPVWVRLFSGTIPAAFSTFQFTHPCGCDWASKVIPQRLKMFQFTHPCGCDPCRISPPLSTGRFQFTHPCGCDFKDLVVWIGENGFNSRTRVGATTGRSSCQNPNLQFQFTHPCGCDGLTNTV